MLNESEITLCLNVLCLVYVCICVHVCVPVGGKGRCVYLEKIGVERDIKICEH